ncbi:MULTISPECIES: integrase arm-type DNA-binding domain-containing protein [unclassified Mesorhizobium]|uniref:tyrosine-type recombinase/integrase n=1 Tax=unclassified Mesorhizobium TaxID=325217 RepID=UPI00333BB7E9
MATAKVLTAEAVKSAKPDPDKRIERPDAALPGLYLVIQPSGVKSWALRYRFAGSPKKLTLGPVLTERSDPVGGELPLGAAMTLVEARSAARTALQAIAEGKDPSKAKKVSKALQALAGDKDTVKVLGESFIDRYAKPRNRSWAEVERQFKVEINPVFGDLRAKDITKRQVLDLLDGIIDRGSPVTANRVFASLRKFFSWLVDRDVITASPCAGVKMPTAEKSRERVLSDDELRLFWKATGALDYPFGPMFRLLLVTGQRREEVSGMTLKEIALGADAVWTLPGARVKNGIEHIVPLSTMATEIIEGLPKIGKKGFVFTTTGDTHVTGYSRSKDRLDAKMLEIMRSDAQERGEDQEAVKAIPHWTLHDLRRTVASRLAGLNINLPVIEKLLNHVSGTFAGIVGVYQRHEFKDEKRRAMNAWADYLGALFNDQPATNVLQMKAVKK